MALSRALARRPFTCRILYHAAPAVFWSFPSQRGAIVSLFVRARTSSVLPRCWGTISQKRVFVLNADQQMQNRLDAAREARAASEQQSKELQAAITTERAARPESVRLFLLRTYITVDRPRATTIGPTRSSAGTLSCEDEGAGRTASGARCAWRM